MRYSRDAGRSTNRTLTFGEELLESLLDKRSDVSISLLEPRLVTECDQELRPITFIAHGVGGIVVKAVSTDLLWVLRHLTQLRH